MASMSRPLQIHQYHPTLSSGDAISSQLQWIRATLNRSGIHSEIVTAKGFEVQQEQLKQSDLILIHHSQFNPHLDELMQFSAPKALVYHNITPSKFYHHDAVVFSECQRGRKQLRTLMGKTIANFVDSHYNGEELEHLGFENISRLPLVNLQGRAIPSRNRPPKSPKRIIFVGRIAPHKNQLLLIQALWNLQSWFPGGYHLSLVGSGDPIYLSYLEDWIAALGLENQIDVLGKVTDSSLESLYASSHAYVSCSLHEGFGIPLVEAMCHGLPVFALSKTAVRETLGNAGVQFETEDPAQLAQLLRAGLNDSSLLDRIVEGQNQRIKQLQREHSAALILQKLTSLVETEPNDERKRKAQEHTHPLQRDLS